MSRGHVPHDADDDEGKKLEPMPPETFFVDPQGGITYKRAGELKTSTITSKLDEALRGIVSAGEGRGEYRSVQ